MNNSAKIIEKKVAEEMVEQEFHEGYERAAYEDGYGNALWAMHHEIELTINGLERELVELSNNPIADVRERFTEVDALEMKIAILKSAAEVE